MKFLFGKTEKGRRRNLWESTGYRTPSVKLMGRACFSLEHVTFRGGRACVSSEGRARKLWESTGDRTPYSQIIGQSMFQSGARRTSDGRAQFPHASQPACGGIHKASPHILPNSRCGASTPTWLPHAGDILLRNVRARWKFAGAAFAQSKHWSSLRMWREIDVISRASCIDAAALLRGGCGFESRRRSKWRLCGRCI